MAERIAGRQRGQDRQASVAARLGEIARAEPGLTAIALMALAGIAISIYLTVIHYAKIPPVCTTGGVVDCSSVLLSPYSLVPGTTIPVTIPGMLWFAVSGGLALAGLIAWVRGQAEPAWRRPALFAWAALGLLFVLYLVYAEIVRLHRICEWCTVVHLLTLATFLITFRRWQEPPAAAPGRATRATGAALPPSRVTMPRSTSSPTARRSAATSSGRRSHGRGGR
jgi:uncharacterized membrane protein